MHSVSDCKYQAPRQNSMPEGVARAGLQARHSDLHGLPHLPRLPGPERLVGDERVVLQLPQKEQSGSCTAESMAEGRYWRRMWTVQCGQCNVVSRR